NAGFARRCAEAGLTFVGPRAEILECFGDKGQARALAERCGVPVLPGTSGPTSLEQAREFLASLGAGGAMMIKAVAGGGGRGMRARLTAAAVRLAETVRYNNVGTFEFLVDATTMNNDEATYAFIEANPRLQVEHTVTEEVTGVDLVQLQLQLAAGRSLTELRL